jgi:hypothetical protein
VEIIITSSARSVYLQKAKLVDLGLIALSRGEWRMVAAITRLLQKRGWCYE